MLQDSGKEAFIADIPSKMKPFEDFLGDNPWMAGNSLTFCDFHMYEVFLTYKLFAPEVVAKFPKILAYIDRFEKLPQIAAYMKSDRYLATPFFNKMAKWGNK